MKTDQTSKLKLKQISYLFSVLIKRYCLPLALILFYSTLNAQSESEPNDNFNQSNSITWSTDYKAYIGSVGDDDYYKFNVTQPGMIKFELLDAPSNVDLHAILFNSKSSNASIHKNYNAKNGDIFNIWVSTCHIGDHYLLLQDGGVGSQSGSQFSETEFYRFNIQFIAFDSTDPCECENETISSACQIEIGQVNKAHIAPWFEFNNGRPILDFDYYELNITQPSNVKLEVSFVPDNIELDVFIFDQNKTQIWSDKTHDEGETFTIWFSTCNIGKHYLFFRDDGVGFNPEQQYNFQVDTFSMYKLDSCECNNSFNQACSIDLCQKIQGTINPWFEYNDNRPIRDNDYYKIELSADKQVDINFSFVPTNIEICASIYNSSWNKIISRCGRKGQPIDLNFIPPTDGLYYIVIEDDETNFNPEQQYTFTVGCNLKSVNEDQSRKLDLSIFPNPVSDKLNIRFEQSINHNIEVKIFDLLGNSLKSDIVINSKSIAVNTESFPQGIMILIIKQGNTEYIHKFLKTK